MMPNCGHETVSVCFFSCLLGQNKLLSLLVTKEHQQKKYLDFGSVSALATRCTWPLRLKDIDSLPNYKRTPKGSKSISTVEVAKAQRTSHDRMMVRRCTLY